MLALLAIAVLAVLLKRAGAENERALGDDDTPEQTRRSKWFFHEDTSAPAPDGVSAPEPRTLRVVDSHDKPVSGATVTILQSPLLDAQIADKDDNFLRCDDFDHLSQRIAALRAAPRPKVLETGITNDAGEVRFETAARGETVISVEAPGRFAFTTRDRQGDRVELPDFDTIDSRVQVFNLGSEPVRAQVLLVDLATGEISSQASAGEGDVKTRRGRLQWLIVQADGYFPSVTELDGAALEISVPLSRLGVVEVVAPKDLESARIALARFHRREARLQNGRARFERQLSGTIIVELIEPGFIGSGDGRLEDGETVVIALSARRSAALSLVVVSALGEPVAGVAAALSVGGVSVSATAGEEGERLALGPVPAGPGLLNLTAPGFRSVGRSLEVLPGEHELEVVLEAAPTIVGTVVDLAGKPVAGASVFVETEEPNDPIGPVTGDDGTFEVHVQESGAWDLQVTSADNDAVGHATVQVPTAGPVTITLEPLAQVVVRVFDPDGKPAQGARILLGSPRDSMPIENVTDENGVAELSALKPGSYHLEIEDTDRSRAFRPVTQELVLAPGAAPELNIKTFASASIEGRIVDEEGQPVGFASLLLKGDRQSDGEADEKGEFIIEGLEPKTMVELRLIAEGFIGLTPASVMSGSKGITLKASRAPMIHGRVVDDEGKPVGDFEINDRLVEAEDGRFEVPANTEGTLTVAREDVDLVTVEVKGRTDVGDIRVTRRRELHGRLVNAERQPVASFTLRSEAFASEYVTTDGQGRFVASVSAATGPFTIEGHRGELSVYATVALSDREVELVVVAPTRVEGQVRGKAGQVSVSTVVVSNTLREDLRVDTDAQGRFSLSVPPGTWLFGVRSLGVTRSVNVQGERLWVELGIPDEACELRVRSVPPPSAVWFAPKGVSWNPMPFTDNVLPPGVVSLWAEGGAFVGRGLTCSAGEVFAEFGPEVRSQPVVELLPKTEVQFVPPSLSDLGNAMGTQDAYPPPVVHENRILKIESVPGAAFE